MFAGGFDFLEVEEVAVAVGGLGILLEHLAVTDDGVEGSTELMGHGGEEGAFDGAGVFGGAAAGGDALVFDGEEDEETDAAEDGESGGHFHTGESFLGEAFAFIESGEFDFADEFVEVGAGLEFTAFFDESGGEIPFTDPAGLGGGGEFGEFPVGEFFDFGKAGADGAMGLTQFAELGQLAVDAFHGAGIGGEELGFAGEEEGAGAGFGAGEGELKLANEADGATILAGEEIGLNALFPVEENGADAEEEREGADEDIEHLVERTESRRPGAHGTIMARMGAKLLRWGMLSLLAVDDDPLSLDLVRDALALMGLRILTALNGAQAMRVVAESRPQIVILDLMLPDVSGLKLLSEILQTAPGTDVILLTGHYTPESAVEAIRDGACDYLTKPVNIGALRARVKELVDDAERRLLAERLESELMLANRFQGMVGRSPQMLELFALIKRVAPHFRVALVRGATGTGKEPAAQALHAMSPVAAGPFVIANCSAITETLFESEMFGHMKGSFTGATNDKKGLFEAAHGGTLFLDEIGDLPIGMQSKLLRAIQQQEIKPVGSTATKKISVRVVAATNRPLEEMMSAGTFRGDLYYRLSMVEIHVPELSERMEDFPYLARHFVAQFAEEFGKRVSGITPRAQALLARHGWPGNVRELENVIGSACMMAEGEIVDARDLPPAFQRQTGPVLVSTAPVSAGVELLSLELLSQRHARAILEHFDGNKSKAAKVLGVTRSTLYRLLGEG